MPKQLFIGGPRDGEWLKVDPNFHGDTLTTKEADRGPE